MNKKRCWRIVKYRTRLLYKWLKNIIIKIQPLIYKIKNSEKYLKIENIFGEKALIFFLVLFLFALIIYSLDPINTVDDYRGGLIVEITGFLFDITLFGLFLMWYDHWKSKKYKIEQEKRNKENKIISYIEEIDDYREWKEKEASYRIFGLVKRLKKLDIHTFDLSYCYFEDVRFSNNMMIGFNFTKSNLIGTTFKDCILWGSCFDDVGKHTINGFGDFLTFWHEPTRFINCELHSSMFINSKFYRLFFLDACRLKHSKFNDSIFSNCKFENAKLENCSFTNIKFNDKCEFINIDFTICKMEEIYYTKDCIFTDCKLNEKMKLIEK